MKVPKGLEYGRVMSSNQELRQERYEWEQEARDISNYLLPGRGIYQLYTKPRKRRLTSPKVVNNTGEDALYVLTSAMHAGLTSPMMPWFVLNWADKELNDFEPLKAWLQDCEDRLHAALQRSNFYNIINNFYIEYAGFGTGCMYMGEDTPLDGPPFRFELLTFGEYAFSDGTDGLPSVFARPIFMSERQLVEKYPDTVSKDCKERVEKNEGGIDRIRNVSVIEYLVKQSFLDKRWTRIIYQITGGHAHSKGEYRDIDKDPLAIDGFYEFPYPRGRWGTIGSDIYGIGPGARGLADIKRLQDMEKSFAMATHKDIDPPVNAPARMRGKLNTLPGGKNYYSNPNEKVDKIYDVRFNYEGVSIAIERVEDRIRRNFFNDVFLTAMRDPNASPLRTGQVQVEQGEKLIRLGPVVERLQYEFFTQIIERGFNIMMRKDLMPTLSPELADLAGDYNITMISPMATAQRRVALDGLSNFVGFLGQAAQFDQRVLDNVDPDRAAQFVANVNNVKYEHGLRTQDEVDEARRIRAEQVAREKARQDAIEAATTAASVDQSTATAAKAQSEAGLNLIEGQQVVEELGAV